MGEFRSVCMCVFFWSSSLIKTKISNYITLKSELYRFDWMYCGKWERSALKIIEIKKRKKKHTLSYTIILMIWLNWTMVGFWNKFTILFRSQLNTFFFSKKEDMKFLRKKKNHINDEYNGHCRCIKINFNRLHWQWMAPQMKTHTL